MNAVANVASTPIVKTVAVEIVKATALTVVSHAAAGAILVGAGVVANKVQKRRAAKAATETPNED